MRKTVLCKTTRPVESAGFGELRHHPGIFCKTAQSRKKESPGWQIKLSQ
jgi:hypothetical protein